MLRRVFGKKNAAPGGWQIGDPPEMGKGLEQPMPRISSNPVMRRAGTNQVEEVRAAIEHSITSRGYCSLAMPERVFINVYFGLSGFVAGPDTQWRIVSPRDWVTVVTGLEAMGEIVAYNSWRRFSNINRETFATLRANWTTSTDCGKSCYAGARSILIVLRCCNAILRGIIGGFWFGNPFHTKIPCVSAQT